MTVPLTERWRKRVIYKIWYNVSFQHIGATWSILFLKEMPLTKKIMLNYAIILKIAKVPLFGSTHLWKWMFSSFQFLLNSLSLLKTWCFLSPFIYFFTRYLILSELFRYTIMRLLEVARVLTARKCARIGLLRSI